MDNNTFPEVNWDLRRGWIVQSAPPSVARWGAKAVGLTALPPAWSVPWVAIPMDICHHAHSNSDWAALAEAILTHIVPVAYKHQHRHGLLVRSSAPTEDMDFRGFFDSKRCGMSRDELADTIRLVAFQATTSTPSNELKCAVVVQLFLPSEQIGHLSNEYRHAQRSVDFLFEIETLNTNSGSSPGKQPRNFRLQRPVDVPDDGKPINLGYKFTEASLRKGLMLVAAWLAAQNRRGHIEWVVHNGFLYLVQFDIDALPPRIHPMSELKSPTEKVGKSEPDAGLAVFCRVGQTEHQNFSTLRKTRSHTLLHRAEAFVPPIWVAANIGKSMLLADSLFWQDLECLLSTGKPAVIRFDVPLERSEWTNLPTLGPLTSLVEARAQIETALGKILARDILLDDLSVVVHHFVAARASAWSEAQPGNSAVRIDAIWGLPDGLQTFVHDSLICDTLSNAVTTHIRYKDRFIDVDPNGAWVTRKAFPALAMDLACGVETAKEIARVTSRVSELTQKPVRIMWFLDVVQGGGGKTPAAMPWIVVEVEAGIDLIAPWKDAPDYLRRLAGLHARKAITNRTTLARFQNDPKAMDVGGRHVLLQPDASAVRDRQFLADFAEAISSLPNQWKVLYAGSMLAHAPYQLQQFGLAVLPIHAEFKPPRRIYSRKLVRDRIPERIAAGGEHAEIVTLTQDQFALTLRQKLIEESLEVAYAIGRIDICEELADLLTVAKKIAAVEGLDSWAKVEETEREKTERRGGFDAKLYLKATGHPAITAEESPGGAHILRLKSGSGVRIPLVPPLRSQDRQRVFYLPKMGCSMIVRFREQEIDVFLTPIEQRLESNRDQLSLFT